MFGDEKEYQVTQRGGIKRCYLILELKSDGWFVRNEVSKTEHGESFRSIMVENGYTYFHTSGRSTQMAADRTST